MANREFDQDRIAGYIREEWKRVEIDTRWTCIRCGKCCRSNWSINLTWYELERVASTEVDLDLGIETDPRTGLDHPYFVIRDACPFLKKEGMVCTLHPDWFYTCATYPFLLMPDGRLLYHTECSGMGCGSTVDAEMMKKNIISERKRAGMMV